MVAVFVASAVVLIILSLITPKPDKETLNKFLESLRKWGSEDDQEMPQFRIRWDVVEHEFKEGGGDCEQQLEEECAEEWKRRLGDYVISPIDKYTGEMAII